MIDPVLSCGGRWWADLELNTEPHALEGVAAGHAASVLRLALVPQLSAQVSGSNHRGICVGRLDGFSVGRRGPDADRPAV